MKVAEFLLRTLEANGIRHIFGNPGTTEIPLVRACEASRRIRYVVALSEVSAVPMADGYARATRALSVVNLHVAPGLGNGMGNLYTAGIAGTPLLVLVGGQDRRFLHTNPILWGPLEAMAGAVCKQVFSLSSTYDAAANLRNALRAALTPPYAPVALICPPDLLEENINAVTTPVHAPALGTLSASDASRYAAFLSAAKHPALVAAEDVHWAGAADALQRLAAVIRAPVYVAPYTGVLPVDSAAPCYAGYLPPSMTQIAERLAQHDALLFLGGRGLRTTLYSGAKLPQRKAWLGHDPGVTAPDGEFELLCMADLRLGIEAITEAAQENGFRRRKARAARTSISLPAEGKKLHPTRAIKSILDRYEDALWVDESGLSTSDVRQWMRLPAGRYLINGSGGIGWGLPAALGAALAQPDRLTVAVIGDGSALYASEALWTAARYRARLLLVILSNRRYATLNEAAQRLTGNTLASFTLEPPVLDFSGLATLYGGHYASASTERELIRALDSLSQSDQRITLLELKLDPALKPVTASRHF